MKKIIVIALALVFTASAVIAHTGYPVTWWAAGKYFILDTQDNYDTNHDHYLPDTGIATKIVQYIFSGADITDAANKDKYIKLGHDGTDGFITPGTGSLVISDAEFTTATGTFSSIDINGGTIDDTIIGGTTPAAGTFTSLAATTATTATRVDTVPSTVTVGATDHITVSSSHIRVTTAGGSVLSTATPTFVGSAAVVSAIDKSISTTVATEAPSGQAWADLVDITGIEVGDSLTFQTGPETLVVGSFGSGNVVLFTTSFTNTQAVGQTVTQDGYPVGQTTITVDSDSDLSDAVAGDYVIFDIGQTNEETLQIASATDDTHLVLASGTTYTHADGVTVTMPQITDGTRLVIEGVSDTDYLQIQCEPVREGTRLRPCVYPTADLKKGVSIEFVYLGNAEQAWYVISAATGQLHSQNWGGVILKDVSDTPHYVGGFYAHAATPFTPSGTPQTLGTANVAYGAHAYIVLGDASTDMVVTVTGTSVTDAGVRTTSDTEDIDTSGGSLNDFHETNKKWIGQISYTLKSGTAVSVNYGLNKYWDHNNTDFFVRGIEVTGFSATADSAFDIKVYRHSTTGWTYNAAAPATPPTPLYTLQGEYVTEYQLGAGEQFAWKLSGLNDYVHGNDSQGMIIEVDSSANKSVFFDVELVYTD